MEYNNGEVIEQDFSELFEDEVEIQQKETTEVIVESKQEEVKKDETPIEYWEKYAKEKGLQVSSLEELLDKLDKKETANESDFEASYNKEIKDFEILRQDLKSQSKDEFLFNYYTKIKGYSDEKAKEEIDDIKETNTLDLEYKRKLREVDTDIENELKKLQQNKNEKRTIYEKEQELKNQEEQIEYQKDLMKLETTIKDLDLSFLTNKEEKKFVSEAIKKAFVEEDDNGFTFYDKLAMDINEAPKMFLYYMYFDKMLNNLTTKEKNKLFESLSDEPIFSKKDYNADEYKDDLELLSSIYKPE